MRALLPWRSLHDTIALMLGVMIPAGSQVLTHPMALTASTFEKLVLSFY